MESIPPDRMMTQSLLEVFFCISLKFNPFVEVPFCRLLGHQFVSSRGRNLIKPSLAVVELVEVPTPVSIEPGGAIYGIEMVFLYPFEGGVAQAVNSGPGLVCLPDEPGERRLIGFPGDLLGDYPTPCS